MITKATFIAIADKLDEFYNGEINESFEKLGIVDNRITDCMDAIVEALDQEMDPECYAQEDSNIIYSSYLCEWLFHTGEFQEMCPTAAALYDYIDSKYTNEAE